MDILFMSIFEKKDRILITFFPASFHLAGLEFYYIGKLQNKYILKE